MNDNRKIRPVRGLLRLVRKLLVLVLFLIAGLAVAGYAAGWIEIRHDARPEKATIEIETGDVKKTAKKAVEKGRQLVDELANRAGLEEEEPAGATTTEAGDSPPRFP